MTGEHCINSLIQGLQRYGSLDALTEKQRACRDDLYRQLEQRFMPLLRAAVYHYRWLDTLDDLWQVARWSFYQGAMKFDLQGKVFFEYYSKRKVYGDLRTHTRRLGRVREREQAVLSETESGVMASGDLLLSYSVEPKGLSGIEWQDLLSEQVLRKQERSILLALYVWGYKQQEVAKLLRIDRGTVRKYHQSALMKLRRQMPSR